ncbi:hypothetical protein N0V88_004801 [Collariella sp. IMI 366227]|nr:hypothetical protein N0V88_004801 [Collariella sp. IMI 366227]
MSTYEVKGRVAIVTGAGSGIGHALTEVLLAAGCSVVIADLKLRPEADASLSKHPHPPSVSGAPSAVFVQTDLTNWRQINDLWAAALKFFGHVHIVASIAGIYEPPWSNFWKPPGISLESHDLENAEVGQYATIAVNQVAPIRLAQIAIDYWAQNREVQGNFLAVASVAAYLHSIETPLYMASKAALVSFVKSLGGIRDLLGIRIAAVCPGQVLTPLFEPEWNKKLVADDISLSSQECAAVILRVLQEPQWGDGSIVETQKKGAEEAFEIEVRDVHLEVLYPMPFGRPNDRVVQSRQKLLKQLQEKGMRA